MGWLRANVTQADLAEAEQEFLAVCNTDGEVDEDVVEQAYKNMQRAAAAADEAFTAIREGVDDWAPVVASVLR